MLLHWVSQRHPGRTGVAVGEIQRGFSAGAALGPLIAGSLVGSVGFAVTWAAAAATAVVASWLFAMSTLKYNAL